MPPSPVRASPQCIVMDVALPVSSGTRTQMYEAPEAFQRSISWGMTFPCQSVNQMSEPSFAA
jgi:hypothetical protein